MPLGTGWPKGLLTQQIGTNGKRGGSSNNASSKIQAWEEFSEAIQKDFRLASKRFWTTIWQLRSGWGGFAQAVFGGGGETLTSNEDNVDQWKEHFDQHLNLVEVSEVVSKLLSGKSPGVDEIHPEMLKALDVVGLSWLTRLCSVGWTSGTVPLDWQTRIMVLNLKKGDRRVCANYQSITLRGFRPSFGIMDQFFTLLQIVEGAWEFVNPVFMCFVEKAYDRVPLRYPEGGLPGVWGACATTPGHSTSVLLE
ncbi:uncharacterized protein LOC118823042 [Colossoma macropomum]|uniref:uncharacterized protein LOC118823042 n=1 Tax=Colossoma macropomum TaxID=42526 RepID=UPI001864C0B3|nr:uncharacterized protein LOC118823042 [Colossoma macropomum]